MAASASLVIATLPLPTPIFLPIVAPGIDRVRFVRGAPGASVSICVGGSMSISLFSSCALALPISAAFGVLVRARPDRRVGDALFTSDSITKFFPPLFRSISSRGILFGIGAKVYRPAFVCKVMEGRERDIHSARH
ncbi:hypothetical protein PMIN01_12000 [Paraphaeosphaeria minitans]|uniref:Uncharacterized protein n=1 Tax=Paraphaeosphaeria minitans TaxID=565426 RepID=A0A9P6G6M4_9PLEO|nr:hypothetical protein PMIN01_12000 [Paraphaeosphaeria minitans]